MINDKNCIIILHNCFIAVIFHKLFCWSKKNDCKHCLYSRLAAISTFSTVDHEYSQINHECGLITVFHYYKNADNHNTSSFCFLNNTGFSEVYTISTNEQTVLKVSTRTKHEVHY